MNKRFKNVQLLNSTHKNAGKYELVVISEETYHLESYLVNNSNESLPYVISGSGGCLTIDDEAIALSSNDRIYENVEPGEAVLVDIFHIVYDSDGLAQLNIFIKESEDLEFTIRYIVGKNPKNVILIDGLGKPYKYATIDFNNNQESITNEKAQ